jgi:hypothetical protein
MLNNHPQLKKNLHYLLIHPYTSRPRLWARIFLIPFVIKKGKGAIIRRKARLDIIPSKKITLGIKSVIEDYAIINNGMGDITIGDYTHVTSRVKLVGPVTLGNYVTIGSGAQITGLTHNYLDVDRPIAKQGVSIIRKTKCFDFLERNVLFPKTKRSFFRTPKHPYPAPLRLISHFKLFIRNLIISPKITTFV